MKFSIIIPNVIVNEKLLELTKLCINRLKESSSDDDIYIIIDNKSTMGSEFLKDNADIYIHNREIKSVAESWNQGLRLMDDSDYALLVNNDTLAPLNWRDELLKCFEDTKNGAASLSSETCDFSEIDLDKYKWPKSDRGIVKFSSFSGSFWAIKREAIRNTGYFDENYKKAYCEDTDYLNKLLLNGWEFVSSCNHPILHYGRATSNTLGWEYFKDSRLWNNLYFKAKWGIDHTEWYKQRDDLLSGKIKPNKVDLVKLKQKMRMVIKEELNKKK